MRVPDDRIAVGQQEQVELELEQPAVSVAQLLLESRTCWRTARIT